MMKFQISVYTLFSVMLQLFFVHTLFSSAFPFFSNTHTLHMSLLLYLLSFMSASFRLLLLSYSNVLLPVRFVFQRGVTSISHVTSLRTVPGSACSLSSGEFGIVSDNHSTCLFQNNGFGKHFLGKARSHPEGRREFSGSGCSYLVRSG